MSDTSDSDVIRDDLTIPMFGDTPAPAQPVVSPSAYRVLARKYRPQTFDDLIGRMRWCRRSRTRLLPTEFRKPGF